MDKSSIQILITVSTILKHIPRYYLIFCAFSLFCPLAFAVPVLLHVLSLIFSSLQETSFFSLVPDYVLWLTWWFILDLFCPVFFPGPPNYSVSLWPLRSMWQETCWILEESSSSQLVMYIRDILFSENVPMFTEGALSTNLFTNQWHTQESLMSWLLRIPQFKN